MRAAASCISGRQWSGIARQRQVAARTTLIVCPSNVKHKWGRFAAELYPEAATFVLDGLEPGARHAYEVYVDGVRAATPWPLGVATRPPPQRGSDAHPD